MNPKGKSTMWQSNLIATKDGTPRALLANAITAFREAPEWKGVLWFNDFTKEITLRKPPPWEAGAAAWTPMVWTDRCDALSADWLQRASIAVTHRVAGTAAYAVAEDQRFHPVRDYLDGLVWDGVGRIDDWVANYLGAANTPYNRAVGSRWLISAVARIMQPGCKADCALVLEGRQGARKSSAIHALATPWTADRLSDLSTKDAFSELQGVWIVELAELEAMGRADVGTIKAFMSRGVDRFRLPYGRHAESFRRQCVFVGTVNPGNGYLRDATGARRFWPVKCGDIRLEHLIEDRDKLWAEAVFRYRAHESWWLESVELEDLARIEQADRFECDPWHESIEAYLRDKSDRSVGEILSEGLGIEKSKWDQRSQNRVVSCLQVLGFERYRAREGELRPWRYRRPLRAAA